MWWEAGDVAGKLFFLCVKAWMLIIIVAGIKTLKPRTHSKAIFSATGFMLSFTFWLILFGIHRQVAIQGQTCQILTWKHLCLLPARGAKGHGMRPGKIQTAAEQMWQRCGNEREVKLCRLKIPPQPKSFLLFPFWLVICSEHLGAR